MLQSFGLRYLNEEEMKPILHYLHPGESAYAGFYSKYLIHEVGFNLLFKLVKNTQKNK